MIPVQALVAALARQVMLPEDFYALSPEQRRTATTVSGLTGIDQIQFVIEQLNQTLASGGTFAEFQRRVRTGEMAVGLPDYRLDLVFRMNVQAAYSLGRWRQQMSDDSRPYLLYSAINDNRVRPTHLALNRIVRPKDDPFWQVYYPPWAWRCRCAAIGITQVQAERYGITPVDQIPSLPVEDGMGMRPDQRITMLEALIAERLAAIKQNHPLAANEINRLRDSMADAGIAAEQVNDALVPLTNAMQGRLQDAIEIAADLGLSDPTGLRIAAQYLDGQGSELNSLLTMARTSTAALLAAALVTAALNELEQAAPNDKVVQLAAGRFDAALLQEGQVIQLGQNILATGDGLGPATLIVRGGGIDLAATGFEGVLLVAGTVYLVVSVERSDSGTVITLEPSDAEAEMVFYLSSM